MKLSVFNTQIDIGYKTMYNCNRFSKEKNIYIDMYKKY